MKRFQLNQGDKLQDFLSDSMEKAALNAVHAAALRVVSDIQTRIIPAESPQPVDRRVYRGAWRVNRIAKGAEIVNNSPHSVFIEYGVRPENVKPGRKMIDALAAWVKRKGIAKVGGTERNIAFAIAQSMRKKGIFNRRGTGDEGGLRILEQGLKEIDRYIPRELGKAIKKAFR